MHLYFLDKNRELVSIVDTAESIQWRERYYEVGTFEIKIKMDSNLKNTLDNSYFIVKEDNDRIGVIEYYDSLDSVDEGDFITISGRFAECLLGYRISRYKREYPRTITDDEGNETIISTVGDIIIDLLNENVLNPVLQSDEIDRGLTVSPRKITGIDTNVINKLTDSTTTISVQTSYEDNLLELILSLLNEINASIKLSLDDNNMFIITLFEGLDRSYKQETNDFVVFAKDYDNLLSTNYIYDETEEVNAVYVGGEEQENRAEGRIITKYETPVNNDVVSDLDRKEIFIDADDIEQQWTDEYGRLQPALSDEDYTELLITRAKENVIKPIEQLEANINLDTYEYGIDYYIGDIVVIRDNIFGEFNKRIIGIDFIDETESTIEPIFEE